MISNQLLRAYEGLRAKQSAQSAAFQLTNFAKKVRATSRHIHRGEWDEKLVSFRQEPNPQYFPQPKPKPLPPLTGVFTKSFPYSGGQPNPQYTTNPSGGSTVAGSYYNVVAFSNPLQGRLSVGVSGGVYSDTPWGGNTVYTPLPDRWIGGDAISSSASLSQVVGIPENVPRFKVGNNISADVEFSWNSMGLLGIDQPIQDLIYTAVSTSPGLPNSALNGFVGVTVMAELNLTLASDKAILGTSQAYYNILNWGVDAEFPGVGDDRSPAPFLFLDFVFRNDPSSPINLSGSIPSQPGATRLFIEVVVRVTGTRGGVNDPNAGYLATGFIDVYHGASQVASFLPQASNPFVVNKIFAYF